MILDDIRPYEFFVSDNPWNVGYDEHNSIDPTKKML